MIKAVVLALLVSTQALAADCCCTNKQPDPVLELVVGKIYVTRKGEKARIYALDGATISRVYDGGKTYPHNPVHGAVLEPNGWETRSWSSTGCYDSDCERSDFDIVGTWKGK